MCNKSNMLTTYMKLSIDVHLMYKNIRKCLKGSFCPFVTFSDLKSPFIIFFLFLMKKGEKKSEILFLLKFADIIESLEKSLIYAATHFKRLGFTSLHFS